MRRKIAGMHSPLAHGAAFKVIACMTAEAPDGTLLYVAVGGILSPSPAE
jgi:hypothetical protein